VAAAEQACAATLVRARDARNRHSLYLLLPVTAGPDPAARYRQGRASARGSPGRAVTR